jgi:transcriptional regulator with XRE-family HTH domain
MTHREDDLMNAHARSGCTFGWTLRTRRIEAGLSQSGLARRAGIDPAYVNRMERGSRGGLRRTIALALAAALELGPAETDRFLFAAGLAPEVDWQSRVEDVELRLRQVVSAVRDWPESWTPVEEAEEIA